MGNILLEAIHALREGKELKEDFELISDGPGYSASIRFCLIDEDGEFKGKVAGFSYDDQSLYIFSDNIEKVINDLKDIEDNSYNEGEVNFYGDVDEIRSTKLSELTDWTIEDFKNQEGLIEVKDIDEFMQDFELFEEEDSSRGEWDENILQPAIDEINAEKGIALDYESNGDFGEILTILNSENEDIEKPGVVFEKGDIQLDDGQWNDDHTEKFYQTLSLFYAELKFKTKEEFKNYVLSKMIIL